VGHKRLYLVTHAFPYLNSETFLESELPWLVNRFKVVVVPSVVSGEPRDMPEGVEVDHRLAERFSRPGRKLKATFRPSTWQAVLRDAGRHHFRLSGVRRSVSFMADAWAAADWHQTLSSESAIYYSYWLNGKTWGLINAVREHANQYVVARTHRFDLYDDWFDPPFWPLRQQTLADIDALFVISQDGLRWLQHRYETHSAIGVSRLGVCDPQLQSCRSTDGVLRICSVSSLLPQKRVACLAELLVRYCADFPDRQVAWQHFGDGPLRGEVESVLRTAKADNLSASMPGVVSNPEVLAWYRDNPVDLFVNVSDSEGIPVSIMEAQSCGIPAMATNVGGVSEIVNDENGFLIEEQLDYSVMKAILHRVAGGESPSPETIRAGFLRQYHADHNYAEFAGFLDQVSNGQCPAWSEASNGQSDAT